MSNRDRLSGFFSAAKEAYDSNDVDTLWSLHQEWVWARAKTDKLMATLWDDYQPHNTLAAKQREATDEGYTLPPWELAPHLDGLVLHHGAHAPCVKAGNDLQYDMADGTSVLYREGPNRFYKVEVTPPAPVGSPDCEPAYGEGGTLLKGQAVTSLPPVPVPPSPVASPLEEAMGVKPQDNPLRGPQLVGPDVTKIRAMVEALPDRFESRCPDCEANATLAEPPARDCTVCGCSRVVGRVAGSGDRFPCVECGQSFMDRDFTRILDHGLEVHELCARQEVEPAKPLWDLRKHAIRRQRKAKRYHQCQACKKPVMHGDEWVSVEGRLKPRAHFQCADAVVAGGDK